MKANTLEIDRKASFLFQKMSITNSSLINLTLYLQKAKQKQNKEKCNVGNTNDKMANKLECLQCFLNMNF